MSPALSGKLESVLEWCGSKRIFLIEDDTTVTAVVSDMLEALGFSVLSAKDGAEAFSKFRSLHQNISCIILDYGIPGMHPSQFIEEARTLAPEVGIILSSGYPRPHIARDFSLEAVNSFIQKPYDPEDLIFELGKLSDLDI